MSRLPIDISIYIKLEIEISIYKQHIQNKQKYFFKNILQKISKYFFQIEY